ncbi:tetratricopeptide repeat protein [Adhaeretor mobilis]|uniref:Tetratricopeptide repeat protein n=1 Tax=Adhaeretor mobilis TaxID=1930276 RepID=A0A517N2K1_9BACT|nr:hypothetical protein [Adhaeretor mobilis]QDT01355.1 Tetratricopeptide repeat protein [Adhaeretor mobilis]
MADSYDDALRYRAVKLFTEGDFDSAITLFDELVQNTDDAWDCSWRANTLLLLGRYEESHTTYLRVLETHPDDISTLQHLAYILAACPFSNLRDGNKAVEYATRACDLTAWKNWASLSVLAAAYAELSDWTKAQLYAKQALGVAPGEEKNNQESAIQLYDNQKLFRASPERDRARLRSRLCQWKVPSYGGDNADTPNDK